MRINNKKKRILITGGAGFIGSNLIIELQKNYKIICLDRNDQYLKLKKVVNRNVTLVKGEITNEVLLDKLVKNCDIIIHLAGGGGNQACIENPIWAVKTHLLGTHLLLKNALKYKIKQFIFASSCFVYGKFSKQSKVFSESRKPQPVDFYGTLKTIAEKLILDSGVNYCIFRFANVYGFSQLYPLQKHGAINNFIRATLNKERLQIYGSGKQKIDYIHLRDALKSIIFVLNKTSSKTIYNVGSGKLISIEKLAQTISKVFKEEFKEKVQIERVSVSLEKIYSSPLMSIKKIKRDLGWLPTIPLETGIKEIILNNKK